MIWADLGLRTRVLQVNLQLLHAERGSKRLTPEARFLFLISYAHMVSWVYSLEINPFQAKALYTASMALPETKDLGLQRVRIA